MTTYRFEEIARQGRKTLPCPACSKKVRRQRTFTMTLNPWNKNPDGSVRTRGEIWAALGEQVTEWQESPETCSACQDAADVAS